MGGYPALFAALSEEVAREAAAIGAAAEAQRDALIAAARQAAAAERDERLARARREAEAARRAALGAEALERERMVFLEQRRQLAALRAAVEDRLLDVADPELLSRLLPELLVELGDGPFTLVVDPGDEDACRRALAGTPERARATIAAAPARRGGVTAVMGRRVLDDTLRSRLERAWTALEPELAARLFGKGPRWRTSTT